MVTNEHKILAFSFLAMEVDGEKRVTLLNVPFYIDPMKEDLEAVVSKDAYIVINWYISEKFGELTEHNVLDFDDIYDYYCDKFDLDTTVEYPEDKPYLN